MPYRKMLKRFIRTAGVNGGEGALLYISSNLISIWSFITEACLPTRRNAFAVKLLDVIGLTEMLFHCLENFFLLLG